MARIKNEPKEPQQYSSVKQVKEVRKIGPMFEEETNAEALRNHEKNIQMQKEMEQAKKIEKLNEDENLKEQENTIAVEESKKRRGRPRKNPLPDENVVEKPKRGRGRPRKNPLPDENQERIENIEQDDSSVLPGFDDVEENEDTILPGFEEVKQEESTVLPGFEETEKEEDTVLPGFEKKEQEKDTVLQEFEQEESNPLPGFENTNNYSRFENTNSNVLPGLEEKQEVPDVDISNLLTSDKKVACFIGTTKNGTSFIVNNLAEITSNMGIDTAILDTTKNRNSYYIYTKNEEELRKIAMNSVSNLVQGTANGIQVNKNLTVYTSLPDETEGIENAGTILQTLLRKHSLVLIDCDFKTPIEYFNKAQEIYLVQSFDILTIQPLTAFLRDLKSKNVLSENKLKIVLNKAIKLRGVNDKTIIGGMAYYNDPAMSFMTELFDKNVIRYITVPFSEEVYTKYMENVINCEVSVKGYSKNMVQVLNELANVVYPLVSGKSTYVPPKVERNGFTPSMKSTLDQMKRRY